MKNLILIAALISTQLAFAADAFKLIHVKDLQRLLNSKKGNVYIYDANNEKTRKEDGLIPGAKPLDTVSEYDVAKTLPSDKKATLVFYCASTQCTASHTAANRAAEAGYKNVKVMADGIKGWKEAGKPTEKL